MSISDQLMKLGRWNLRLDKDAPQEVVDRLDHFGHVAYVPGRVINVAAHEDELLTLARYVGVVRGFSRSDGEIELRGSGMSIWLGEDEVGDVFETAKTFDDETFANTIRELLPNAVEEGTLHSVAGTYTGNHRWQTPREAIDYVCETFEAEWRVNGDATFDAGPPSQLFKTEPEALIVRKGAGVDMTLRAPIADIRTEKDAEEWVSRVVVLGEGTGDQIKTGSAEIGVNPYKDLHGNPVKRTQVVSESSTEEQNAEVRAEIILNDRSKERRELRVSTLEFNIEGEIHPGDTVYIYDPDAGLIDADNTVVFRGQVIHPTTMRVTGVTYPIHEGATVAYRDIDGDWHDLTEYVQWEDRATEVTVGSYPRTLTDRTEPLRPRPDIDVDDDPGTTPAAPDLNTPFESYVFLDAEGRTVSAIIADWDQPLNTDGSTITGGAHYEVAYRVDGETQWTNTFVGFDTTFHTLQPLSPGVDYDIRVRAWNIWGRAGAWSSTETMEAEPDTIAPSEPAAPEVNGGVLRVFVRHTLGKAEGGTYNLELDLAKMEFHASQTSGFTADEDNLVATANVDAGNINFEIPAIAHFAVVDTGTWYVRAVAVDRSGNRSDPSETGSDTVVQIGPDELLDEAVLEEKLADSAVTADKIKAGEVDGTHIAVAAIDTAHIGEAVIQTVHIGDAQILEAKIGDAAITSAKIQDLAVTDAKIETIAAEKISVGTLTGHRIEAAQLFGTQIFGGEIHGAYFTTGHHHARYITIEQTDPDTINWHTTASHPGSMVAHTNTSMRWYPPGSHTNSFIAMSTANIHARIDTRFTIDGVFRVRQRNNLSTTFETFDGSIRSHRIHRFIHDSYRNHVRIERPGQSGSPYIDLTPSTDRGGSLRFVLDGSHRASVGRDGFHHAGYLSASGDVHGHTFRGTAVRPILPTDSRNGGHGSGSYPDGVSFMVFGSNSSGWPVSNGMVMTIVMARGNGQRIYQKVFPKTLASGSTRHEYVRTRNGSDSGWLPWHWNGGG